MKYSSFLFMFYFLLTGCTNRAQPQDPLPVYTGFTIVSKQVNETRTMNVWTPPGYTESSTPLPVLYMLDGGVKEDFPHIANTLSDLIANKRIPPMLLVGIENTERRRDLTGATVVEQDKKIAPVVGGAEKFRAFIAEELFPEIEKRYKTNGKRGIIGESVAGLFVVETFLIQPELFDYYIAMDPSLWWNNHYLVRTAKTHLAALPPAEKRFWFAGSSAKDIAKHTRELSKILTEGAYKPLLWKYSAEPKEQHATIFRATKEKALVWTFNPITP